MERCARAPRGGARPHATHHVDAPARAPQECASGAARGEHVRAKVGRRRPSLAALKKTRSDPPFRYVSAGFPSPSLPAELSPNAKNTSTAPRWRAAEVAEHCHVTDAAHV